LAFGALLALQACGSDPAAAPGPVGPAPTPVPTPPVASIPANVDFVSAYIIPSLQAQYGNLELMAEVQVGGTNAVIAPGVYSWADMNARILEMVNGCGCFEQNAQIPQGMANGFVNLNYNDFYLFIGGSNGQLFNPWYNVQVRTQSGHRTSFYHIFNLLVTTAYSYYSNYYYSYVYNYGSWGSYNYWPQQNNTQVGGSLSYDSGTGFSINVGGMFSF